MTLNGYGAEQALVENAKWSFCDSLIGTKVIYAFETLNTTPEEDDKIDIA